LIVIIGSLILAISAKIQTPLSPVPATMQTFAVLFTGVVLGAKYGFVTLAFYILEGALGIPVFAGTPEKGMGIIYLLGPTGGYIFGYAITAFFAGILITKKNNFFKNKNTFFTFIKLFICLVPTYFFGLIWLGMVIGWDKPILELGLYPFILGEIFKISLLTVIIKKILKL